MSKLVETLKQEHANIGKIMGMVQDHGIGTEAGRRALLSAKIGLLSHLSREDGHLYPALAKPAEDDPLIADALDFFLEDIAVDSEKALRFFEKYESADSEADFSTDFEELVGLLTQRVRKEESVIFKMYDQL